MFRGHSQRSLDSKGRLMLPPQFREVLFAKDQTGRLMLTNFDGCVAGYPIPEWEAIESSFYQINQLNRKLRDFQRFFLSGAVEVSLDKQGRILVPPFLKNYGGLDREVVLTGVGRRFEIWDVSRFEEKRKMTEQDFDEILDHLVDNGYELRI